MFLNLTGGEPLLVKHTPEILKRAREKGIITSMNCNGTLLPNRYKELNNTLNKIFISLDSPNADLHDKLRGQEGCYSKAIKAVELCRDMGINTAINMTVTMDSFDQMEEMALLAKEMDVALYMRPVSVIFTEFQNVSNADKHTFSKETYVKNMLALKKKYPHIKTSKAYLNFVATGGFNNFQCKAMELSINIKPDGSVVLPCGYYPTYKFDRNEKTLKQLIKTQEFQKKTEIKWYDFCKDCTLSCFYVPAAMLRVENILSLVDSYAK